MHKKIIIERIKKALSYDEKICLPKHIDMRYDEGTGTISMKIFRTWANMQEDCAAFESWVLAIKASLNERVKKFDLEWTKPEENAVPAKGKKREAYNRFLYRVNKFMMYFPGLLEVSQEQEQKQCFKTEYEKVFGTFGTSDDWYVNNSEGRNSETIPETIPVRGKRGSERERWVEYKMLPFLKKQFAAPGCRCGNQFPVGVFKGKVHTPNRIMCGGAAAIDLWGIDGNGRAHIFELKRKFEDHRKQKRPIGILSETLFYTSIIRDLQARALRPDESHEDVEAIRESQGIRAHLLVPPGGLHPLIVHSKVIDFMNDKPYFRQADIVFDVLEYKECNEKYTWSRKD